MQNFRQHLKGSKTMWDTWAREENIKVGLRETGPKED
jgi:hypothetical protein